MTMYLVTVGGLHVVDGPATDDDFDDYTDDVLVTLGSCPGIADADKTVSLTNRTVEYTMTVDASDPATALKHAWAAVRTAVHTNHGHTGGWDDVLPHAHATVEPTDRAVLADA